MTRRPTRMTTTDTLYPYTTLFRCIGEILVVERIENAGPRGIGKTEHRDGAQMLVAQHRFDPATERRIDQPPVEIDRRVRNGDRMPLRRNQSIQECQRFGVDQRPALRPEARARQRSTEGESV